MNDDLDLGRLLGRREAFQIVAARCTAADASLLRDIRERKLYIGHAKDWEEFCLKHLHTSKQNANRLIHILEEFGPGYFEVAQFTRISPATYRAIAPAVQDHTLEHNGETIALVPENAERVTAALSQLKKAAKALPAAAPKAAAPATPPEDPIPALERHCTELVKEFTDLIEQRHHELRIKAAIGSLRSRLHYIELTI